MDAEEVEDEGRGDQKRVTIAKFERVHRAHDELLDEEWGLLRADRLEPDRLSPIGMPIDHEVVVALEVAAPGVGEREEEAVQVQDEPIEWGSLVGL